MKTLSAILLCGLFSAAAVAGEQDSAQKCLTFSISKMQQNPELQQQLRQSKPVTAEMTSERFDDYVGSQHIATQLTFPLEKAGRPAGKMLCLLEQDKPLYFYYSEPE